jgi:hypothetical protein
MREIPDLHDGAAVRWGRDIKVRVGQQLRVVYGDVMDQEVPDRCSELLKQLDGMKGVTRE